MDFAKTIFKDIHLKKKKVVIITGKNLLYKYYYKLNKRFARQIKIFTRTPP